VNWGGIEVNRYINAFVKKQRTRDDQIQHLTLALITIFVALLASNWWMYLLVFFNTALLIIALVANYHLVHSKEGRADG
jgi:hypothetical protein